MGAIFGNIGKVGFGGVGRRDDDSRVFSHLGSLGITANLHAKLGVKPVWNHAVRKVIHFDSFDAIIILKLFVHRIWISTQNTDI